MVATLRPETPEKDKYGHLGAFMVFSWCCCQKTPVRVTYWLEAQASME